MQVDQYNAKCVKCEKVKKLKKFHSNWDESGPWHTCKQCDQEAEHDFKRRMKEKRKESHA